MRGVPVTRNASLAKIHIAKEQLCLDDDTYRDVLERVTGKRSSSGMTETARGLVIAEFKRMGWSGGFGTIKKSQKGYVRKVYALWGDLKRSGIWREDGVKSLRAFVKKMTDCDDPEWMTYAQASRVIEALKKMKARA